MVNKKTTHVISVPSYLVGGFNHLEKYESQWEGLSRILWKTINVPNHQPVIFPHEFPLK